MSLKFVLLGFIDRIPASGYQTRSQIYRTLDELLAERLEGLDTNNQRMIEYFRRTNAYS